jgi:hypothetical protein
MHRGLRGRQPFLAAAAGDVLDDHDGIVHHQAHPQRQPAQGHEVQREPAEVDEAEGGDHRYRDGGGRDQGEAQVAQEEQQHEQRKAAAVEDRAADVLDGTLDIAGIVDGHADPELREVRAQAPHLLLHGTGHLHGVGV